MGKRLGFRILGPLTVAVGERTLTVDGARRRTVLGMLLLRAGRTVSVDTLVDEVWNGRPPATARTQIAIVVAALRKTFREEGAGEDVIVTAHPGYRLDPGRHRLDADVFGELVERAEEAVREGRPEAAAEDYTAALALWRGPARSDPTRPPASRSLSGRAGGTRPSAPAAVSRPGAGPRPRR